MVLTLCFPLCALCWFCPPPSFSPVLKRPLPRHEKLKKLSFLSKLYLTFSLCRSAFPGASLSSMLLCAVGVVGFYLLGSTKPPLLPCRRSLWGWGAWWSCSQPAVCHALSSVVTFCKNTVPNAFRFKAVPRILFFFFNPLASQSLCSLG